MIDSLLLPEFVVQRVFIELCMTIYLIRCRIEERTAIIRCGRFDMFGLYDPHALHFPSPRKNIACILDRHLRISGADAAGVSMRCVVVFLNEDFPKIALVVFCIVRHRFWIQWLQYVCSVCFRLQVSRETTFTCNVNDELHQFGSMPPTYFSNAVSPHMPGQHPSPISRFHAPRGALPSVHGCRDRCR